MALGVGLARHPAEHVDRLEPRSSPATMSVLMRSPIIAVYSELASNALSTDRIISGFSLPTYYGLTPTARSINAATEHVAGSGPPGLGPTLSRFVAMKPAPLSTSSIARVTPRNCTCESPEGHVVGFAIGECVADIVHRSREPR